MVKRLFDGNKVLCRGNPNPVETINPQQLAINKQVSFH